MYLVFGGWYYYPDGGWNDFWQAFEDRDEAADFARRLVTEGVVTKPADPPFPERRRKVEWSQVVDVEAREVVEEFSAEAAIHT